MKTIHLFLVFCTGFVFASDPFDKSQRKKGNNASQTNITTPLVKCHENQIRLFSETTFEQLKIVGLLGLKDKKQILLQNDQQKILSAVEGDFIGYEGYKLQKINAKTVQFIRWKKDCHPGDTITLNF